MDKEVRVQGMGWVDWFGWAVIIVLVIASYCLYGCSGEKDGGSILPTVAGEATAGILICQDWNGVRPDRQVQRQRAERDPDYCFVADVCFYACPPPGGHR